MNAEEYITIAGKQFKNANQNYEFITISSLKKFMEDWAAVNKNSTPVYSIEYHSSYAVFNQKTQMVIADSEALAIDKFWKGKNKEDWEIMSVKNI